jgi:hypothetical protein
LHGHISPFWKDVLSILDPNSVIGLVLRENIKFKIGDGSSILFWSDEWIGSNALRSIFPKLYQISTFRNGLVNEMGQWVNDQWRWNLVWRRKLLSYEEQQYHHLLSMLEPTIIRQGKDDKLIWSCNSDGSFSVKSCCTLIDNTSSATDRVFEANVWIKGAPPKVQVFLWLAVQDKVSTRAFLHQRTVLSATQASCVFCSSNLETSEHLFIHCNFSRSVWMKVLDWWGIQCCLPRTIDLLLLQWPEMVHGKFQRSAWRLISSSTIWGIWLLRNKIVFEEGTINLFDCFSTILHRVAIWLHSQDSNFNYTGNDLLRSSDGIKLWCNKKS